MASEPNQCKEARTRGQMAGRRGLAGPLPPQIHQHFRDCHVTYSVKEIFKTLQGEGGQAGRAAVFCRFAGCNLWTGREEDRAAAVCQFCDTDFVGTDGQGGGRFKDADELADAIETAWNGAREFRYVVFTGGEPLLQLDAPLISAVAARGFAIPIQTNRTIAAPPGIGWIWRRSQG